eukprot:TRINITY_DN14653_c0_g1_i2.p1 TRINITY_DN14653_c0_g1~~TRINITY_DN14653_c0_g1_i2.p1  ORF type:complete len:136 (+),score=3.91 TRINITY_DN14653_c0_g1_i2:215-622(+)
MISLPHILLANESSLVKDLADTFSPILSNTMLYQWFCILGIVIMILENLFVFGLILFALAKFFSFLFKIIVSLIAPCIRFIFRSIIYAAVLFFALAFLMNIIISCVGYFREEETEKISEFVQTQFRQLIEFIKSH